MQLSYNINNKRSHVSQIALELATKGHQIKHGRIYSFEMMSIQEKEEDQIP